MKIAVITGASWKQKNRKFRYWSMLQALVSSALSPKWTWTGSLI